VGRPGNEKSRGPFPSCAGGPRGSVPFAWAVIRSCQGQTKSHGPDPAHGSWSLVSAALPPLSHQNVGTDLPPAAPLVGASARTIRIDIRSAPPPLEGLGGHRWPWPPAADGTRRRTAMSTPPPARRHRHAATGTRPTGQRARRRFRSTCRMSASSGRPPVSRAPVSGTPLSRAPVSGAPGSPAGDGRRHPTTGRALGRRAWARDPSLTGRGPDAAGGWAFG